MFFGFCPRKIAVDSAFIQRIILYCKLGPQRGETGSLTLRQFLRAKNFKKSHMKNLPKVGQKNTNVHVKFKNTETCRADIAHSVKRLSCHLIHKLSL